MSEVPNFRGVEPEQVRKHALRYLRRAITRIELGEATGVVVILLGDKGIDRLWCAYSADRHVLAEVTLAAAGLAAQFRDKWALRANQDIPNELDPPGVTPVPDPEDA